MPELTDIQLATPRSRHRALDPCHSDLLGTFPILDHIKCHFRLSTRDYHRTHLVPKVEPSVDWLGEASSQFQISADRTLRTSITRPINCLLSMIDWGNIEAPINFGCFS
jgi:hypothetical protein